jgi:membrane protease YdiL (CAAX protease family)
MSMLAALILWQRPGALALSSWHPKLLDVTLGCVLGYVYQHIIIEVVFQGSVGSREGVVEIVSVNLLAPPLEEFLARGVALGSLLNRYSPVRSILTVAAILALLHPNSGEAFVAQSLLCTLYVVRGRSVISPLACHFTMNAVNTFPGLRF